MNKSVVVTDGEQRSALAVVRSLGKAGYKVHVCSVRRRSIAAASRYCATSHPLADPMGDPRGFLAGLEKVVRQAGATVLLPISEAALLAVLPNRGLFDCVIPFPDARAFERICDKRQVLSEASGLGIAVPDQIEIATAADAAGTTSHPLFPVVIKSSRSVAGDAGEKVRIPVAYADTGEELRHALRRIPPGAYPLLIQQRIRGPGFGISVLVWDGKLIAAFGHRRIREKPPSGGVSVVSESIPVDDDLLSRSLSLLRAFDWNGVAMIEYKRSAEGGVPYLMEINGRFWGSMQLAIDSGVDFPRLLVDAAVGVRVIPVTSYDTGARLRWEWGDVDHLAAVLREPALASSHGRKTSRGLRLRAIGQFLGGFRLGRPEILRADDPRPFARETIDWLLRR